MYARVYMYVQYVHIYQWLAIATYKYAYTSTQRSIYIHTHMRAHAHYILPMASGKNKIINKQINKTSGQKSVISRLLFYLNYKK